MAGEVKAAKDIGWDHITLNQKGFSGAVQSYKADNGATVAVGFNLHEAFVVEDDMGLFGVDDIKDGIIRAKDIDIERTGMIEGLTTIAWEDDSNPGEVQFNSEELARLGIDDFSVKESITQRILLLSALDQLKDAL